MPSPEPPLELRTYFGPAECSVYGAVHLPADRVVRGAVLVCPPLAKEHSDALRGLRRLADSLAARGLAVLRFDYYGTGDSAVPAGADGVVDDWVESVRHAAAYLRALGVGEPATIALRGGALVAAEARLAGPAAVLWDPIPTGRVAAREQTALAAIAVGASPSDGERTWVGLTIADGAVDRLSALRLNPPGAPRVLLATRPGAAPSAIEELAAATGADRLTVEGMPEFVQPADHLVRIPDRAITDITQWLAAAMPALDPVVVAPPIRTQARIPLPDGGAITERIEMIGAGTTAIRTLPDGPAHASVLLCATANDTRHGPNREWVHTARAAAAAGAAALRFDRQGAAESGPVGADETVALFPPSGIDDAVAAARSLDGPLLVAGLCSGSWYAAQVGRRIAPDAVVLVNSVLYSWRLKPGVDAVDRAGALGVPRSDPAFRRSPRGRAKDLLRRRLPYRAWELLGRRGVTQVPGVLLDPLVRAGVRVTTILAPPDAAWFDDQRGPEGWLRSTARKGAPAAVAIRTSRGDHAGCHPEVRNATRTDILLWCADR